jgi:CRP-like cAMP-binding protein
MPKTFELAEIDLHNDYQIQSLLSACPTAELVQFLDGEVMIREGQSSNDIFLVLSGGYVVEKEQAADKNSPAQPLAAVTNYPEKFSFVGEMAYFGDAPRSASVRCTGSVHTIKLHPHDLNIIIDNIPFFTRTLCRQFTRRLRETTETLENLRGQMALPRELVFRNSGEKIVEKGRPADTLYMIIQGEVAVETESGMQSLEPEQLPMNFIDPIPFFKAINCERTIVARTGVTLMAVPGKYKEGIIRNFPELMLKLLK